MQQLHESMAKTPEAKEVADGPAVRETEAEAEDGSKGPCVIAAEVEDTGVAEVPAAPATDAKATDGAEAPVSTATTAETAGTAMAEAAGDPAEADAAAHDEDAARAARIREAIARGEAPIKPQYLIPVGKASAAQGAGSSAATGGAGSAGRASVDGGGPSGAEEPPKKKQRRGQNKAKDRVGNMAAMKLVRASQLCARLAYMNSCPGESDANACKHPHDVEAVLSSKPPALADKCPVLERLGVCPAGLNCRFGGHIVSSKNVDRDGVELSPSSPWAEKVLGIGQPAGETNVFSFEQVSQLRKRSLDFSRSEAVVKEWQRHCSSPGSDWSARVGCIADTERRPLDLRGKRVLAPLTTVGNLPFRRLCMKLGCEVTVGEMALSNSILEGAPAELALLRRHESETCFGVQVAGGDVEVMTKIAQFVDEKVDCDFLDINSGCPLDEVHRRGAGSRLMSRAKAMEGIVRCMSSVLKTKHLTLKMRTAHFEEHGKKAEEFQGRIAHKLMPQLEEWGVSAITLHGRTARQRYTKLADWNYVNECSLRRTKRTPLIACGDVLSWEEAEEHCKMHGVDSIMLGRGALIKPWLFTEIAEQRHWDISASERFDMLRDFTHFGLDHWGADARGVETTRRFLLEWLSFTCRYVPIGLLEQLPPKINWRPRPYVGRSDLETKLASQQSQDWVSISEMLLGPVPDGFSFIPKHKSASYDQSGRDAGQAQTEQG